MTRPSSILLLLLLLPAACSSSPPMPTTTGGPLMLVPDPPPPAGEQGAAGTKEDRAALERELRGKQRELAHARRELDTQQIDEQARALSLQTARDKAQFELGRAQQELATFLQIVAPKELEQRRIAHQQQVYGAEHAKDELDELEAMYRAEEFAKATKELVLKRGRRELELAQRRMAVSAIELKLLEERTLPDREAELRRKVADAEAEVQKVALDADKARIEMELAAARARDKIEDLELQIGDLQQKLQGRAAGGGGQDQEQP